MQDFTMSQYKNLEDLYKAKAEYWERLFMELAAYDFENDPDCCFDTLSEHIADLIDRMEG